MGKNKNLLGRVFSYYKDHYVMPKEFLPQVAKQNRDNCITVSHLLLIASLLALGFFHWYFHSSLQTIRHSSILVYFSIIFFSSFINLFIGKNQKRRKVMNSLMNNITLVLTSFSIIGAIWYNFYIFQSVFNSTVLLASFSILMIALFDIEPLYFLVLDPVSMAFLTPTVYKQYDIIGVIDVWILAVVVIWLAYYNRRISIRSYLKNEMLKVHKEGLQLEVEQQIEQINEKEAALVEQHQKIILIQNNTIIGLSNLVENRDSDTGQHVRRTAAYVGILARALFDKDIYTETITKEFIELVIKAAPMHDIGKIVVPDSVLKKPGKLTPDEFKQIQRHTTEGGRIVREILGTTEEPEYVKIAKEIASCHHEKWNGTGYPYGLKGSEIPLSARIMAVADVFDALVSPRCYKDPISVDEAFVILEEGKGSHFDPVMIPLFLAKRKEIESVMNMYKD